MAAGLGILHDHAPEHDSRACNRSIIMVAGVSAQPDLDAIRELEALRQAFQAAPGNRHFRFQHLFLNVVDHPAARIRPQGEPITALQTPPAPNLMHAVMCLCIHKTLHFPSNRRPA